MAARTVHPSTRPASLDLTGNPTWRGLQIIDTVAGGPDDDTGIVEFRATYPVPGGGVGVQQEAVAVRPRGQSLDRLHSLPRALRSAGDLDEVVAVAVVAAC
jgi:hypothetical protein